jgi:hypothetical protein
MTSRNHRWTAVAGLLLLAAAVALLWPRDGASPTSGDGSGPESLSNTGAGARGAAQAAAPGAADAPSQRPPVVEQIPMPGCWDGLHALDKTASLDTLRQALALALAGNDKWLAGYITERLTEVVGGDAGKALQVLEWAKGASGPELGVYMDALKAAPAVHDGKVVESLFQLGEDKSMPLQTRGAALDALETQRRLSPGDLKRLKALALDESLDQAAWVATRTLGRVMKEDFERTGNYQPYWKELLSISGKSDDMAVRLLALEMPSYSNPIIGEESFSELTRILKTDRERDVREMAAFRLGVTSEPEKALEAYRDAWKTEADECVRWAIFRFAVRAAGPQALPTLEQFAAQDPRFARDYTEFRDLYAAGTVDFARIWLGKGEYHECLVEEGAPH